MALDAIKTLIHPQLLHQYREQTKDFIQTVKLMTGTINCKVLFIQAITCEINIQKNSEYAF